MGKLAPKSMSNQQRSALTLSLYSTVNARVKEMLKSLAHTNTGHRNFSAKEGEGK